jgi:hypothetical protein
MKRALEQIRRRRGGAQAHLMRCADAVTDVELQPEHNDRHRFVQDTLRDAASSLWT